LLANAHQIRTVVCCFGPNALEDKLELLNNVAGVSPGYYRSFQEYERELLDAYDVTMVVFPPGGRQCRTKRVCRNVIIC